MTQASPSFGMARQGWQGLEQNDSGHGLSSEGGILMGRTYDIDAMCR
jgi:hypothetical protein